MADVHSKEVRSYNMSRIRSKNTKPELLVRKYLFSKGFRYRIHSNNLPGKPDIVLAKHKTVIFIHGCFWHGHNRCKYFVVPKTRTEWWMNKIGRNKELDEKHRKELKKSKWTVIVLFECSLKKANHQTTLSTLEKRIRKISKIKPLPLPSKIKPDNI